MHFTSIIECIFEWKKSGNWLDGEKWHTLSLKQAQNMSFSIKTHKIMRESEYQQEKKLSYVAVIFPYNFVKRWNQRALFLQRGGIAGDGRLWKSLKHTHGSNQEKLREMMMMRWRLRWRTLNSDSHSSTTPWSMANIFPHLVWGDLNLKHRNSSHYNSNPDICFRKKKPSEFFMLFRNKTPSTTVCEHSSKWAS